MILPYLQTLRRSDKLEQSGIKKIAQTVVNYFPN